VSPKGTRIRPYKIRHGPVIRKTPISWEFLGSNGDARRVSDPTPSLLHSFGLCFFLVLGSQDCNVLRMGEMDEAQPGE